MNPPPQKQTDAIRSDIDLTRQRMDDTMDALGERLQPQHLLDEVIGFFRRSSDSDNERFARIKEKVTRSADTAVHAVTDTVKHNPLPLLLIGAGVAWLIYQNRREKTRGFESDYVEDDFSAGRYDPDTHYDRPLEYPAGFAGAEGTLGQSTDLSGSDTSGLKDKASAAAGQVKEKFSQAGNAVREKAGALKERAGQVGARVKDSTRQAYTRTRERVVTTADQHPLEVGLVALAAGVVAGLAIPTPNAVNRTVGPTADRLRQRTREASNELVEKGKRVAQAAVTAVRDEAEAQGLTPESLREKAGAVADRAANAGQDAARREGLTPEGNQSGSQPSDPTAARPVM